MFSNSYSYSSHLAAECLALAPPSKTKRMRNPLMSSVSTVSLVEPSRAVIGDGAPQLSASINFRRLRALSRTQIIGRRSVWLGTMLHSASSPLWITSGMARLALHVRSLFPSACARVSDSAAPPPPPRRVASPMWLCCALPQRSPLLFSSLHFALVSVHCVGELSTRRDETADCARARVRVESRSIDGAERSSSRS